jgi:hypothetical protein
MTKVTYICRSPQNKVVTYFILFFIDFILSRFWTFRTTGSSKHDKTFFEKVHLASRLITKNASFFPSAAAPPPPSPCFLDLFYRVFGRFVTRGVQKCDLKQNSQFVFRSRQKKYLLTYVTPLPPPPPPPPTPSTPPLQGAANYKKIGDPRGGWVGQRPKKDWGQIVLKRFFIVFLNSPHRQPPKNVIKKVEKKIGFGLLVNFFVKTFRHDFFAKRFL